MEVLPGITAIARSADRLGAAPSTTATGNRGSLRRSPAVARLEQPRAGDVSRWGAGLVVLTLLGTLVGCIYFLADPAKKWMAEGPAAVLGRRMTLNPAFMFIAIVVWGWLWGIVGAVIAVPMVAITKVFCDHIKVLAPLGELLSGADRRTVVSQVNEPLDQSSAR